MHVDSTHIVTVPELPAHSAVDAQVSPGARGPPGSFKRRAHGSPNSTTSGMQARNAASWRTSPKQAARNCGSRLCTILLSDCLQMVRLAVRPVSYTHLTL